MDIRDRVALQFARAIDEFKLVEEGDRIMIGLSGGKDSLTLVNFLSERRTQMNNNFHIVAAHIKFDNLPYAADMDYLSNFCKERNVEYHLVEDHIRDGHMGNGTCLHCSRFRRAKLMELAREHKCNKLALGHHLDDIVNTLLMNMSQHGRFAGMALKLNMTVGETKYPLTMIRPLCYIAEREIIQFTKEYDYRPVKCRCPWGDTGFRKKTAAATDIFSTISDEARVNIFRAQFNFRTKEKKPEETFSIEDL